ncbi:S-adenosyl-L-methionine-dependent methyltransferase [Fomitiporia mediterranea MF3/22]|uniref:S-adenosyl-L-methionine-dependent methyltransferase n=1 Tax=Fomitiporia mediterranea (strain MF3/22) TaxID=694068 RepID=UPI0004407AA5|nr:S-adenosyl-L-methionine-dependent methyltransferase [Fomitiporia mediterranea MF3/22]EJD07975.1 S-adenosyl-L-methionine-dependent methyltransferase [Fomitiporia mediterranea MF3/22]
MSQEKVSKTKTSATTSVPVQSSKSRLAIRTVVSISALSSSVFVTEKVLAPLFGSVATNLYLQNVVAALIVISTVIPFGVGLGTARKTVVTGALCVAPLVLHRLATWTARLGNPVLGPVLAYAPVLGLLAYSTTDGVREMLSGRSITVKTLAAIATSLLVLHSQPLWTHIKFNRFFSHPALLLVMSWIVAIVEHSSKKPSKLGAQATKRSYTSFIVLFYVTLFCLSQPPMAIRSLPYAHSNGLLRILSSTPSVTGRIVVGEDKTHGFRFLRADHSLLGGVWIGDKYLGKMDDGAEFVRDKDGVKLGESIYSAFVLQEAARLQQKDEPHQNALVIGLGAGIAAQAFMQHGLSTSIVEIDPAVYSAARDYFGVPEPAAAFIEDARDWVHHRAESWTRTYDIVVHDCFSGGGVPAHLFTLEFWEDLRKIMSPDGILAVNYAGLVGSESSKAVYLSLKRTFGQCRVFHDYDIRVPDQKLTSEFINLVFFCSPSSDPLTFRPAKREDYMSSYLREHVLSVLPDREVPPELILGDITPEQERKWVLTDKRNPLGAWQDKGALDHWKVMRTVLPDFVWNTY